MKQGYRAIKIDLRRFVARCGEVNLSQLLAIPVLMFLRHSMPGNEHQQDSGDGFLAVQWRLNGAIYSGATTRTARRHSANRRERAGQPLWVEIANRPAVRGQDVLIP
jgi:hypothetical protein